MRTIRPVQILLCVSMAILVWLGQTGCKHTYHGSSSSDVMIDSLVPDFSHSFRIEYYHGYKLIKVYADNKKQPIASYVIYADKVQLPKELDGTIRIKGPIRSVACMSTTHIGAFELLDRRNWICAAANKYLLCDSAVIRMMDAGTIKDAAKDYQPDYEAIASSHPQVLFTDGDGNGASQILAKLKAMKINIAASRDYYEQEPLARAEWIKFFAAFVDEEKKADSIFTKVKWGYGETVGNVAETGERPTVFCNLPYNGVWYMPCGKNYVAKLITDAGGKFLWNDDEPINGLNLTLNFEQVYQRAANADFWINTATYTTLYEVMNIDPKFKLFKVYKTGNIYNGTKRTSAAGGMDIWETGTFRPDIVLSDLALILHSKAAPLSLYYYQQLK